MADPATNRDYHYVRRTADDVEYATFQRCGDGSALVRRSKMGMVFELDPDAWREALKYLRAEGFLPVGEAKTLDS